MLTDLGRRTLGHLPVWAEDEDALVEAEGGPEASIRSYDLPSFTARLAEDPFTPDLGETEVATVLNTLCEAGLATVDEESGHYRMTQAGFDALHAPREDYEGEPGAVFMDLAPAVAKASAIGG